MPKPDPATLLRPDAGAWLPLALDGERLERHLEALRSGAARGPSGATLLRELMSRAHGGGKPAGRAMVRAAVAVLRLPVPLEVVERDLPLAQQRVLMAAAAPAEAQQRWVLRLAARHLGGQPQPSGESELAAAAALRAFDAEAAAAALGEADADVARYRLCAGGAPPGAGADSPPAPPSPARPSRKRPLSAAFDSPRPRRPARPAQPPEQPPADWDALARDPDEATRSFALCMRGRLGGPAADLARAVRREAQLPACVLELGAEDLEAVVAGALSSALSAGPGAVESKTLARRGENVPLTTSLPLPLFSDAAREVARASGPPVPAASQGALAELLVRLLRRRLRARPRDARALAALGHVLLCPVAASFDARGAAGCLLQAVLCQSAFLLAPLELSSGPVADALAALATALRVMGWAVPAAALLQALGRVEEAFDALYNGPSGAHDARYYKCLWEPPLLEQLMVRHRPDPAHRAELLRILALPQAAFSNSAALKEEVHRGVVRQCVTMLWGDLCPSM